MISIGTDVLLCRISVMVHFYNVIVVIPSTKFIRIVHINFKQLQDLVELYKLSSFPTSGC